MRSSLVSATSLLALLLLEGRQAHATPSISAGTVTSFDAAFASSNPTVSSGFKPGKFKSPVAGGDGLTNVADFASITTESNNATGRYIFSPKAGAAYGAGSVKITDGGPGGSTKTMSLTDTAVNPLETIRQSTPDMTVGRLARPNFMANASRGGGPPRTEAAAFVPDTQSQGDSVFVGNTNGRVLLAAAAPTPSGGSSSFGYTLSPAAGSGGQAADWRPVAANPGSQAQTASVPDAPGIGFNAPAISHSTFVANRGGASAGNRAGFIPVSASGASLGYTYTPGFRGGASSTQRPASSGGTPAAPRATPGAVATTSTGPIFGSSIVGSGVSNTPVAAPKGSVLTPSSTIDFGTIAYGQSETLDLALQNLASVSNSGNPNANNLTIEGYTIAGGQASSFSVASLTAGSVITEGGTLVVPVTVVGTQSGEIASSLTIFTNEGAGLGGVGDSFTYFLDPTVMPEPASIAVLGVGLAALRSVRNRRRRRA